MATNQMVGFKFSKWVLIISNCLDVAHWNSFRGQNKRDKARIVVKMTKKSIKMVLANDEILITWLINYIFISDVASEHYFL